MNPIMPVALFMEETCCSIRSQGFANEEMNMSKILNIVVCSVRNFENDKENAGE
jgi:hypothetical protein